MRPDGDTNRTRPSDRSNNRVANNCDVRSSPNARRDHIQADTRDGNQGHTRNRVDFLGRGGYPGRGDIPDGPHHQVDFLVGPGLPDDYLPRDDSPVDRRRRGDSRDGRHLHQVGSPHPDDCRRRRCRGVHRRDDCQCQAGRHQDVQNRHQDGFRRRIQDDRRRVVQSCRRDASQYRVARRRVVYWVDYNSGG